MCIRQYQLKVIIFAFAHLVIDYHCFAELVSNTLTNPNLKEKKKTKKQKTKKKTKTKRKTKEKQKKPPRYLHVV